MKTKSIPLALIDVNPDQPRKEFAEQEIKELADDIANNGLLQPVRVTSKPDGRYQLLFGARRIKALERLGYTEVWAIVDGDPGRFQSLVMTLAENIQREKLSDWEEAQTCKLIKELLGKDRGIEISVADIAEIIKKSKTWVSRRLSVLGTETEPKVKAGEITVNKIARTKSVPKEVTPDVMPIMREVTPDVMPIIEGKIILEDEEVIDDTSNDEEVIDDTFDDDEDDEENDVALDDFDEDSLEDDNDSDDDVENDVEVPSVPKRAGLGELVAAMMDIAVQLRIALVYKNQDMDSRCWQQLSDISGYIKQCMDKRKS